jgi:hypothetical protein
MDPSVSAAFGPGQADPGDALRFSCRVPSHLEPSQGSHKRIRETGIFFPSPRTVAALAGRGAELLEFAERQTGDPLGLDGAVLVDAELIE